MPTNLTRRQALALPAGPSIHRCRKGTKIGIVQHCPTQFRGAALRHHTAASEHITAIGNGKHMICHLIDDQ